MASLVWCCLALSLLIGSSICKPVDSDYSDYVYEVYSATEPQEDSADNEWSVPEGDIVLSKRDLAVTKDNATPNLTSQQTFLLADVIAKVEGSLVQTAFEIVSVLQDSNGTANVKGDDGVTETVPNLKEAEHETTPLFRNISARSDSSNSDLIAHVSIDRVTVYLANSDTFPVIPTFQLPVHNQSDRNAVLKNQQEIGENEASEKDAGDITRQKRSVSTTTTITMAPFPNAEEIQKGTSTTPETHPRKDIGSSIEVPQIIEHGPSTERTKGGSTKDSSATDSSKTSSASSTVASHVTTGSTTSSKPTSSVGVSTSTPMPVSVSSTTKATTTTKNPVKELKETEDDLKTKVAEIQAEPIILSSRV